MADFVSIDRSAFRRAHGKMPRGTGAWIFDLRCDGEVERFEVTGSFAEASRAAKKKAREVFVRGVWVVAEVRP